MADWPEVSLSELVEIAIGGLWGSETPTAKEDTPVRVIRGVDAHKMSQRDAVDLPIRWVTAKQIANRTLCVGDVVLEASGACGRSYVIRDSDVRGKPTPVSFSNFSRRLIPNAKVEPAYLGYRLKQAYESGEIAAYVTGTAMPNLDVHSALAGISINLPPLQKQRDIAGILGALDDKIEQNRRLSATLETMARALFQSWFVDFDPVRAKVEGRQPVGMDAATATKFPASFEDSALGPIPTGWDVATLGDVLTTLETGRRPKGGVASITSGIPSVGAESINGIGVFDYSKTRYIPEDFYERTTSGRVTDFDVLLYKDGGKPGEFRPRVGMYGLGFPFVKFSINEHVFRMRAERLGQPFLYFLVSSYRVLEDFANKGGKAAIPGINQPDVKSTLIVLPSRELLEKYNDLCLQFCETILRYASESQSLSEVRDNLLPQLLNGKLPVEDVPA